MEKWESDFIVAWTRRLLRNLDRDLDDEAKTRLLAECSQVCTEPWAAKARAIRGNQAEPVDTVSLLKSFCQVLPGGGPEVCVNGAAIRWSFTGDACPCPVGRITNDPVVCLCGIQHLKAMLEPLLGTEFDVVLQESRLKGDDRCTYVATPIKAGDSGVYAVLTVAGSVR